MDSKIPDNEFLDHPDTIAFITRHNEKLLNFLNSVPGIYMAQILMGSYMIGYTQRNDINTLRNILGSAFISAIPLVLGLLDRPALESSGISQVQEQIYLNLRGQGVLIGFVDTGIDYTNPAFIYEDGTSKIKYIYDQTITGNPPAGYIIGTEYSNEQINEALRSENPYDIVPHRDTVGHGTFLASVSAGREVGSFIGAAPDAELIVVKMRTARPFYREKYLIPSEQENAYESTALILGVEYILNKALELDRPVSICIAVGTNQGTHDGYNLAGEYLNNVANNINVCICAAAGNESQSRRHMQGMLTYTGEQQDIDITVGDNAGDIYISIINNVSDRISVAVRSPTGEVIGRVPARNGVVSTNRLVFEPSTVIVEYYFPLEGSGGQMTIVKLINATPGIWTVIVNGDIVLDGTYHAWLPITGFVSPTVEFLSPNPFFTVVFPATTFSLITCGAYNYVNNSLYTHSSWGPTRLPMISPDLTAPGVDVGGYYPGGYGMMTGTSVSASITSGASALMLEWGVVKNNDPAMGTYQIRGYLIRGCSRDENVVYPNNQWGFGRLNLIQSFNRMREL